MPNGVALPRRSRSRHSESCIRDHGKTSTEAATGEITLALIIMTATDEEIITEDKRTMEGLNTEGLNMEGLNTVALNMAALNMGALHIEVLSIAKIETDKKTATKAEEVEAILTILFPTTEVLDITTAETTTGSTTPTARNSPTNHNHSHSMLTRALNFPVARTKADLG